LSLAAADTKKRVADAFDFRRLVFRFCMSIYAVIVLAGILALLTHLSTSTFLRDQFSLTEEANFPTWLASILWLFVGISSYIANITDRMQNRPSRIWLLISFAFLYASMDEVCRIHERIPSWQCYYIVPISIVFALGGPFLWKRLREIPRVRIFLIAGACCYLLSLVLEFYAQIPSLHAALEEIGFIRKWNPIEFTEEMIELFGTAFLVHALLNYNLSRWKLLAGCERETAEIASSTET